MAQYTLKKMEHNWDEYSFWSWWASWRFVDVFAVWGWWGWWNQWCATCGRRGWWGGAWAVIQQIHHKIVWDSFCVVVWVWWTHWNNWWYSKFADICAAWWGAWWASWQNIWWYSDGGSWWWWGSYCSSSWGCCCYWWCWWLYGHSWCRAWANVAWRWGWVKENSNPLYSCFSWTAYTYWEWGYIGCSTSQWQRACCGDGGNGVCVMNRTPWQWWNGVIMIRYPTNWDYWINSSSWWNWYVCWDYCIHRFNSSGTFTILS